MLQFLIAACYNMSYTIQTAKGSWENGLNEQVGERAGGAKT